MGLTSAQKSAIVSTWAKLSSDTKTMEANGAKLFAMLFAKYPDTKAYFPFLPGSTEDDITGAGVGRAHALAVFTGLNAFILALDDAECLNGLSLKFSRNHYDRKISPERLGQVREVFASFLEAVLGAGATAEVKSSWDGLLSFLQDGLAAYK